MATAGTMAANPRVEAFCASDGPEIFRPVAYPTEVWTPDPFDIEAIHGDARDAFDSLLNKVTAPDEDGTKVGRILLLLGESGSGKTHLMRAFRSRAHAQASGYFGYMQMTSASGNYSRYMLHKLIDSLDRPYYRTQADPDATTGLVRLSTALSELDTLPQHDLNRLREDNLNGEERTELVNRLVDRALAAPQLGGFSQPDLVKAMLLLQSSRVGIQAKAIKYLRGERLTERDGRLLDIAQSMDDDHLAKEMIQRLAGLMWAADQSSLILCLDQLEDIFDFDNAEEKFRRAMQGLTSIAAESPNSLMVVACLEDYYDRLRSCLDEPARDRIEQDPHPIMLQSHRSLEEIEQVVAAHLSHLFEEKGTALDMTEPTYPVPRSLLAEQANQTIRSVLFCCKDYHERCIRQGGLAESGDVARPSLPAPSEETVTDRALFELDEAWNDFLASDGQSPPDDEVHLANILARAIESCSDELDRGHRFDAEVNGRQALVSPLWEGSPGVRLQLGICNRSPQGGHLGQQIDQLHRTANQHEHPTIPVVVRSTEYRPKTTGTKIAKTFRKVFEDGGRYVIVHDSDWRAILGLERFSKVNAGNPAYRAWRCRTRPLVRLASLREILNLDDHVQASEDKPASDREKAVVETATRQAVAAQQPSTEVAIGYTTDRAKRPITAVPKQFCRHAAFLGSTGSGKTTAALNILEQLLARGIPTVLVDRKGDLSVYARNVWTASTQDAELSGRQQQLRDRLDVALYTPGHPDGRPLALPVAPDRMSQMKTSDRQQIARQAAHSLGDMLGYGSTGSNASRISIVVKAIELLTQYSDERVTLDILIEYIHRRDDDLITSIGMLDLKLFDRLVQDLQTLRINKALLFPEGGEPLDADRLFGLNRYSKAGKTRLSIISTKFLGDLANVRFWVAQLLLELSRWMSKHPATDLQAAILFDEADVYLPATSKPATKEPMENLLKRARSAGLGVFLATQSPGDFDYKCRENINTWFLGKIKEDTAIKKMKPMLSELKMDVSSRLSGQGIGKFFLVRAGQVVSLQSDRSLVETEQLPEQEILGLAQAGPQ